MPDRVLEVTGLSVSYGGRGRHRVPVRALADVDLSLDRGEALGLVGESGCGKTTLAKALVGLETATGSVVLDGKAVTPRRTREEARRMQMVFQDPYASLNPRLSVRAALEEILRVHRLRPRAEIPARARELVELVGLPARALDIRPGALSGGQRQRVAVARALALEPDVLIADEPTTALDVSVQAVILELFARLCSDLGVGLLLITHNLAVVSAVCDRTAVMYLGRIVEQSPTAALIADPRHPYTQRLFAAVPRLGSGMRERQAALPGDPPDPSQVPSGCAFHPRCALRTERCVAERPALLGAPAAADAPDLADRRAAACHYAWVA
jgi:oligopeptide/dipeptide ABC transporter ATP-binding protein